jgi:hypothetical protein
MYGPFSGRVDRAIIATTSRATPDINNKTSAEEFS